MLSKLKIITAFLILSNFCFGQIPILNSNPSITNKVIYLDFDGQVVSGTAWNSGNTVNALPSTKNAAEILVIWKRISEDYRPFDVNITTDSARFNAAIPNRRIRVVITPTSAWYGSAGGVAFLGSFTWGGTPGTPCWVFENQLGYSTKNMAEAAAHEVGHTLTLRHQSTYSSPSCSKTAEYNPGLGTGVTSWAPIMGVGYSKNVTIWHTGTSATSCNTIQYDHSNSGVGITSPGYLSFLPDDVGNTLGTAKILNLNSVNLLDSGIITQPTDIDAYQFTICNNRYVSIGVKPWALDTTSYLGANLDVRFFLYNATNNILAVDTPLAKLQTLAGLNLTAGTYYFTVDGGRSANYGDYGSLGKYYIRIKATNPPAIAPTILTSTNICAGQNTTLSYTSATAPTQWLWTISGPSATTFSVQNPGLSFSAGIHTISLLATSGTLSACPVTTTLNIGAPPVISINNFTNVLCPGRSVTLTASGASSYTWMPGAFGGTLQTVTPFSTTTYTVFGSDGTCLNSAVTTVTVSPNFTLNASASGTQICAGQSVTITASGANSYTFNPGNITTNPAVFIPDQLTTYVVTGKIQACTKTKGISINVLPHFNVNVNASDTLICAGQSATLTSSGAVSYTYNPGGLTGSTVVVNPTANTIYTVTGKASNQCLEDTLLTIGVKSCEDVTGIQKNNKDAGIRIYPNPSKGNFTIESESNSTSVQILNVSGQVLLTKTLSERSTSIVTENWAAGIYFVKLFKDGVNFYSEKILIE